MKKSRFLLIVLMTLIGALALLCGCGGGGGSPKITLDKTSLQMFMNDEATITATVEDSDDSVVWSSSDTSVARVEDGKITAIGNHRRSGRRFRRVYGKSIFRFSRHSIFSRIAFDRPERKRGNRRVRENRKRNRFGRRAYVCQ